MLQFPEQQHVVDGCRKHCRDAYDRWQNLSGGQQRDTLVFEEVPSLHVSLSKPFTLDYIQIEPFIQHLSSSIGYARR